MSGTSFIQIKNQSKKLQPQTSTRTANFSAAAFCFVFKVCKSPTDNTQILTVYALGDYADPG